MSIVKISQLQVLTTASGATEVPAVDNNVTKKLSLDGITNYVISDIATSTLTAVSFAATSNGTGTNFKVGDDAWIGDVNVSNTIRITGVQNPANGYIIFGNGDNAVKLGRAGTGPVTLTGNLTVNTMTVNNNIVLSEGSDIIGSDGNVTISVADLGLVAEFSTSTITTYVPLVTLVSNVNGLPLASDVGAGARAFVTNATTTTFNAAAVDAGGGGYGMPVFSNGSGWFIG